METILDRIIAQKRKEVELLKDLKHTYQEAGKEKRSFIEKLQQADKVSIISEFKRASPSKGIINDQTNPVEQAILYEKNGASAISVLTDETFFKGSFSDLKAVRESVNLPLLCKDFMIDPVQIQFAASHGADIILLIAAALEKEKLKDLYRYATELGLEVLVEVHNEQELEIALYSEAKLIGVNDRDLKTFNVSLDVTERLANSIKSSGAFPISESGLHQQEDIKRVRDAGANGILVGEAFMKSGNIQQTFSDFRLPLAEGARR